MAKSYHELTRPEKRKIGRRGKDENFCDTLDREFPPHRIHSDTSQSLRELQTEVQREAFAEIHTEIMADAMDEEDAPVTKSNNYRKKYRLSKHSPIPEPVRAIVRAHYGLLNVLLNFHEGRPGGGFAAEKELHRLAESGLKVLPAEANYDLVWDATCKLRRVILKEMSEVQEFTAPEIFRRLRRWLDFDYRMMACLCHAASKWGDLWSEVWKRVLRDGSFWEQLREEPAYKHYLKMKWKQDKLNPVEREAYKERDSRRRKSEGRREYLKAYRSTPEYKTKQRERVQKLRNKQ